MQEKHTKNLQLGMYIHVPFCAKICDYCAFFHETPTKEKIDTYIDTLKIEIGKHRDTRPPNSIYIGGGTPIILPPDQIYQIGDIANDVFFNKKNSAEIKSVCNSSNATINHEICKKTTSAPDDFLQKKNKIIDKKIEWIVEISPLSTTKEKLIALKNIGVNRISIGVQSFNEKTLRTLGRTQTKAMAINAFNLARETGFNNIGLDLIFSIPGQTIEDWQNDLELAISLQPEHISTYNLTFEGDTTLVRKKHNNILTENNEEKSCDFMLFTWNFLENAGYFQYEISNFSKPGFESSHNINTWDMQEWLGFGPSASSQFNFLRFTNVKSLDLWRENVKFNKTHFEDFSQINNETLAIDSIIFGLRMSRGIDFLKLKERFHDVDFGKFTQLIDNLIEEKLAVFNKDFFKLTTTGKLVADAIASEFITHT